MLVEYRAERISSFKRFTQGTVAGVLSFIGTHGISPQVKAESLTAPPGKMLDYSPRYSLDPYTQCGGEGYLDNETVLITPQDDETLTSESLGIIPGECDNPEELVLQPQPTATPVPTPKPEPQPTPTVLVFPRYPQIPLPPPDPSYTKRPEVKGDQECRSKTSATMDLLQEKLFSEYNFVLRHVGIIDCAETFDGNGHARPLENPPRILLPRVFREDNIGYGGAIIHETCHLWQFKRFTEMYPSIWPLPYGISSRKDAEQECYNIQYEAQKKLGDQPENLRDLRNSLLKQFGIVIYNP